MPRSTTRSFFTAAALAALTGAAASAQSFNIEINAHADTTGMPVFFFEGAAGQAGGWNNINATSSIFTLRNTDSVLTNVTFKVEGQGTIVTGPTPGMTGALANVMADYHAVNAGLIKYTIDNLEPGRYALYVYAGHPSDPNARTQVKVLGDQWLPTQVIGGPKNGATVDPGDLHSVHVVDLTFSDDIEIQIEPFTGTATCAAIQLVKLPGSSRLRYYVDDTATGDRNGARWYDAMPDLQEALRAASLAGGDKTEIWVAKGTYKPTAGADRTATFRVPSGLRLIGGFAGTETTLAERIAPALNITNLSGAIGASAHDDNSYTVVTVENASNQTVIDGFTISRGANTALGVDSSGGGVRITNSSPVFRNTKFLNNTASIDGAGVYVRSGAPSFANCLFYNNTLSLGAGAGLAVHADAQATVYNSQFIKNTAGSHGGAAQLYGSARFVNTLFDGNAAPANGGAVNVSATAGAREFNHCTLVGNAATGLGGAIHSDTNNQTFITNSIIYFNTDHAGAGSLKGNLSQFSVMHSAVQLLQGGFTGFGNTTADPLFVDIDGPNNQFGDFDNDFRLRRGSPAIDAGSNALLASDILDLNSNSVVGEAVPFDLLNQPRARATPYAPAYAGQPTVDMGAYEHQPTCPADVNEDGVVNFLDLNMVLTSYGALAPTADTDGDGQVTFVDLNAVLSAYGQQCAD